jgi:GNAT superfamily N-acetyltransferase
MTRRSTKLPLLDRRERLGITPFVVTARFRVFGFDLLNLPTNGQLVGCVYLQKIAKLPRPGYLKRAYGCITYLFVHKHYRGQGLRRQLLREIVQVAQSEGLEYLTGRPEAESHSVYRLHGFKQIDPEMKLALK